MSLYFYKFLFILSFVLIFVLNIHVFFPSSSYLFVDSLILPSITRVTGCKNVVIDNVEVTHNCQAGDTIQIYISNVNDDWNWIKSSIHLFNPLTDNKLENCQLPSQYYTVLPFEYYYTCILPKPPTDSLDIYIQIQIEADGRQTSWFSGVSYAGAPQLAVSTEEFAADVDNIIIKNVSRCSNENILTTDCKSESVVTIDVSNNSSELTDENNASNTDVLLSLVIFIGLPCGCMIAGLIYCLIRRRRGTRIPGVYVPISDIQPDPAAHIAILEDFQQKFDTAELLIVKFGAVWCPPSMKMRPIFEEISQKYGHEAKFYELDIDLCDRLASESHVDSVPAVALYQQGRQLDLISGYDPEGVERIVKKYVGTYGTTVRAKPVRPAQWPPAPESSAPLEPPAPRTDPPPPMMSGYRRNSSYTNSNAHMTSYISYPPPTSPVVIFLPPIQPNYTSYQNESNYYSDNNSYITATPYIQPGLTNSSPPAYGQ